jgi:DNA gyrase/topoisomerase IV subunit B
MAASSWFEVQDSAIDEGARGFTVTSRSSSTDNSVSVVDNRRSIPTDIEKTTKRRSAAET